MITKIIVIIIMKIIIITIITIITIVAMTLWKNQLKMLKVSIFYYCLTCHGHEWACSKEKNVFHFLIKVKTANQCFLTA